MSVISLISTGFSSRGINQGASDVPKSLLIVGKINPAPSLSKTMKWPFAGADGPTVYVPTASRGSTMGSFAMGLEANNSALKREGERCVRERKIPS